MGADRDPTFEASAVRFTTPCWQILGAVAVRLRQNRRRKVRVSNRNKARWYARVRMRDYVRIEPSSVGHSSVALQVHRTLEERVAAWLWFVPSISRNGEERQAA